MKEVGILANAGSVGCLSHILANAGKEALDVSCPLVIKFLESWQTLVSKSHEAKHKFREEFNFKCPWISNYTRWYCKYEVASALNPIMPEIMKFLAGYQTDHQDKLASITNCLSIMNSTIEFNLQWYVWF